MDLDQIEYDEMDYDEACDEMEFDNMDYEDMFCKFRTMFSCITALIVVIYKIWITTK